MPPTIFNFHPKDPLAKLDYLFDWAPLQNNSGLSNWLRDGETILSYEITIEPATGLTKVSDSKVYGDTAILVWLEDGTLNENYTISCKITTSQSRIDKRSGILLIYDR